MDLFVNKKNFDGLNFYFLRNYKKFLFKSFLEKTKNKIGLERETYPPIINLHLDTNADFFPPFCYLIPRLLDFIKFIHSLESLASIWFRVKLVDIPYCVFPSSLTQHSIEYLIDNNHSPDKIKLKQCHSCKYTDLCGGVLKKYLQKYGQSEFHTIPDVPYQIMIEVDHRCNLNCRHCFNRNTYAKNNRTPALNSLKFSTIKEIIDETARLKIPTIRFTGGEALLRSDIFELLSYAKSKGLYVILNSNGILIDETVAKKLNGIVDNVLLSIQGTGREGDNAVGKVGATQAKINALLNLKQFTNATIFIATILRPEILKNKCFELSKIHDLINEIGGVSRWHLCRCIPEKSEFYNEKSEDFKILIDKLTEWQLDKKDFYFHFYPYLISNGIPFCFYDMERVDLVSYGAVFADGHSRLSISPSGHIKPIYYSPINLSDDPRDILGAWNHPFLKDLRELKFLPDACSNCFYKRKCLGGSRFLANLMFGDYSSCDPLMPINKIEKLI